MFQSCILICCVVPRLLERMANTCKSRVTLITAPAGYGKTTLLSNWIRETCNKPPTPCVAWLSIEDTDNDLVKFWIYVSAAIAKSWPGLNNLSPLNSHISREDQVQRYLIELINMLELFSLGVGKPTNDAFFIVLDDYHLIHLASIHSTLGFFIDHLPQHVHLVIASRITPPLLFAKLRASQQLLEINVSELCFTNEELSQYLYLRLGIILLPDQMAILDNRFEGWIGGLQLAILSIDPKGDVNGLFGELSKRNEYVTDFCSKRS